MGADSVVVCHGLRYSLGSDGALSEATLGELEGGSDARIVAAKRVGLKSYYGRVTDGGEYFLFVGAMLGTFGLEGRQSTALSEEKLGEIARDTRERLKRAGLEGEPALHVQLEAQY
jgi:hypothetical protein